MALIIETGAGLSNSDAYVDEAYVTAYATKFGLTFPGTASATQQEVAVRKATQFLDVKYEPRTIGIRAHETQALAWPRVDATDSDGYTQSSTAIPEELKEATAEAAVKALAGEDLLPDVADPGALTAKSTKVGPIEISKEWAAGGKGETKRYSKIDGLLARWLRSSNILVRA